MSDPKTVADLFEFLSNTFAVPTEMWAEHITAYSPPLQSRAIISVRPNLTVVVKNQVRGVHELQVNELIERIPSMMLCVVPLFTPFEQGDTREVQIALKSFAQEFGQHVGKDVLVFNFWTRPDFDYDSYAAQKSSLMNNLDVKGRHLPALYVTNRSPFDSSAFNDPSHRGLLLPMRSIGNERIGRRLTEIADNLKELTIPSKWGHSWERLRSWCEQQGILSVLIGAGLRSS